MEINSKTVRKKAEKQEKINMKGIEPQKGQQFLTLDEKFLLWKKNSKPFKQFTFLDSQLFSEYLNSDLTAIVNSNHSKEEDRMKAALKYSDIINYIGQHCDKEELDAALSNVSFAYNIEKDALKKQILTKKIKKASKKIPINEYFQQLIQQFILQESSPEKTENFAEKSSPIQPSMNNIVDLIVLDDEKNYVEEEGFLDTEEWKIITTRGRFKAPESLNGLESDETNPVKKKLKNNDSKECEPPVYDMTKFSEDDINELIHKKKTKVKAKIKVKVNVNSASKTKLKKTTSSKKLGLNEGVSSSSKSKKQTPSKIKDEEFPILNEGVTSRSKSKKQTFSKIKDEESLSSSEGVSSRSKSKKQTASKIKDEESPQNNPEQHMELYINNEVDSDDGEGFSFFYVTQNIFNKTESYFKKKMKPEHICSCIGGCNDPTICACARYNFDNSGKSACYIYDTKYGKKRLINQLIRKDIHIYECSSECACNKSLCFNSCLNEGDANKPELTNLIVERYNKVYQGENKQLNGFSSKMWGLKTKVFIPANALVLEYCGEIITKKEADRRGEKYDSVNCNYLFDLNKHAEIEEVDESINKIILNIDGVCETRNLNKLKDISENFPLCIDAFFYGNHSRFVNHSCAPNMVAIAVHTENRNILLPRIVFFALKDIQPGDELTIDYNCAPLKDLKNTTELLICLCGAPNCRGYVYEEDNESTGTPSS